jgi:hypothetical protein
MTEAQKIRDKYNGLMQKEIEQLQQDCTHKKTEWLGVMWAPGHMTNYLNKDCVRCGKTLEQREGWIETILDEKATGGIRFATHFSTNCVEESRKEINSE